VKGRTPSKAESDWHDLIATNIGCQACHKETGTRNTYVSIHHIDGRTKPDAHWLVLAPCGGHHQKGYGADPKMPAIHGSLREFERRYGTEMELLAEAASDLLEMGYQVPARVLELTGLDVTA